MLQNLCLMLANQASMYIYNHILVKINGATPNNMYQRPCYLQIRYLVSYMSFLSMLLKEGYEENYLKILIVLWFS